MDNKKKILIAYFSWSGNTQLLAEQIHEIVDADIFAIQREQPYPLNYGDVLDIAKKEIRSGDMPALKNELASIEEYSIIFMGFPNWWSTYPAPVASFLRTYDFSGKTIIPFCTHGGGGIGRSVSNIVKQCPEAEVHEPLSINGNDVSARAGAIENWVKGVMRSTIR